MIIAMIFLAAIVAVETQPIEPVKNLYREGGELVITATPSNIAPLGWGGAGRVEYKPLR